MPTSKVILRIAISIILAWLPVGQPQAAAAASSISVKNIIIMIGDGMGYNHSLAASYYRFGAASMQVYNNFPVQFAERTYSLDGWGYDAALAWSDFNYVISHYTDSAAAATAMATGVKTYNAGIGVDRYGNRTGNIFEAAEASGKSTGVVTTMAFSHATPAGFVAHNISRDNYTAIAQEMLLQSKADVIMGAGNPWFDNDAQPVAVPNTYQYVGGQATWDALVAGTVRSDVDGDGVDEAATLLQDRSQFQALISGPTPERVVGVAHAFTTLQQARSGNVMAGAYEVPFNTNVPTLTEMALAAINVLDNDPDGFALMIEGGAIDWAAAANQPGRLIEEQISFDQAVEAVVNWVETNSNWHETLLIVTGDHETGYLWGPGSNPTWNPLVNHGAKVMPGMQFNALNHTNSLIRLYARGDEARWFNNHVVGTDPMRGNYVDNTSIAWVIFKVLGYEYYTWLPLISKLPKQ